LNSRVISGSVAALSASAAHVVQPRPGCTAGDGQDVADAQLSATQPDRRTGLRRQKALHEARVERWLQQGQPQPAVRIRLEYDCPIVYGADTPYR